jgi:uncharacterized damage-inducible protein DinB
MELESYNVAPLTGFSPRIGRYLAMMDDVSARVLSYVDGLSAEQLSWFPDESCESIGTLLLHIAAVERSWIGEDICRRPMGEEWLPAFAIRFELPQISGKELPYFVNILKKTRDETKTDLAKLTDDDLSREIAPLEPGEKANAEKRFTIEWILYHVLEHEAHHKGQIALMRRLLSSSP